MKPIYDRDGFELDYFKTAVDYMLSLPEVFPKKVGLYGMSLGGSLSLAMASVLGDQINACAVSSTPFASSPGPMKYRGKVVVEASPFKCDVDKQSKDPLNLSGGLQELVRHPRRQIQIDKSQCPLLIMIGEEDGENPGIAKFMINKARDKGRQNLQFDLYEGAGHLIDLPFSPHCKTSRHPYLPPSEKVDYGGTMQPHAIAQFKSWRNLLKFYQTNLYEQ